MKKIAAVFILFATALLAQYTAYAPVSTSSGTISSASTACTGTACLWITLPPNTGSVTAQLSGTFTATVQWEASVDSIAWNSISDAAGGTTSANAAGSWSFATYGLQYFRVRASAYTSGSIKVSVGTSTAALTGQVNLQSTAPGTQQTGNANLSGVMEADGGFTSASGAALTLPGATQSAASAATACGASPCIYLDSTTGQGTALNASGTTVGETVATTTARTANQFVTFINAAGVPQTAAIAAGDLPATLSSGTIAPSLSATPQPINCAAACSPTAAQLSMSQVSNYGQGASSIAITGPTLAAGMNFIMIVGTAQASNYWHYTSTTANVYLDTAGPYTNVGFAAPAVGNSISCFSFQTGAATYSLRCVTLNGTSSGS